MIEDGGSVGRFGAEIRVRGVAANQLGPLGNGPGGAPDEPDPLSGPQEGLGERNTDLSRPEDDVQALSPSRPPFLTAAVTWPGPR